MRFGSSHLTVVALIFVAGLVTSLSLVRTVKSGQQRTPSAVTLEPFALMQTAPPLVEQTCDAI